MPSPKPVAGDVFVWGDNTCMVLGLTTRATGRERPILALLDKTTPSGYRRVLFKCTVAVASACTRSPSRRMATFGRGASTTRASSATCPEDDDEAPAVPGKVTIPGADPDAVVVGAATTDAATFALSDGSVRLGVFQGDHEIGFSATTHAGSTAWRVDTLPIAAVAAGNTHLVMVTEPAPSRGAASAVSPPRSGGAHLERRRAGSARPRRTPRRPAPRRGRSPRRRAGSSSRNAGRPRRRFAGGWHTRAPRRRQRG